MQKVTSRESHDFQRLIPFERHSVLFMYLSGSIPDGNQHMGCDKDASIRRLRQWRSSMNPYISLHNNWSKLLPGKTAGCRSVPDAKQQIQSPAEDIMIQVNGVSMRFNMCSERIDNLKEYVVRLVRGNLAFQEFWALRDVSFEVRRGERVGLIGLNGSGKSTMLKIISGVMKPTKGTVTVHGSIAPMIELGAGFDFELSARENIYLNGAVLGWSNQDMERCYEGIIEFAELEKFQDVAVKNFSSGMIARLGFAIATCRTADVLIIDEILSVGDAAFQKKCFQKMDELTQRGVTVLLVSHSAKDMVRMCDRVLWLDHGELVMEGESRSIVHQYLERLDSR